MNKFAFIIFLASVFSCSDEHISSDKEDTHRKNLYISTAILSTKSIIPAKQFSMGSTLGLFITNEKIDKLHKGMCKFKNVKALAVKTEGSSVKWELCSKIDLEEEEEALKIYAYHPYQSDKNSLPTQIPVQISSVASETSDYMYGKHMKGHKPVNTNCPYALLSMKHALSLIAFQVKLSKDVPKPEKLDAIQISNKAGGNTLCSKGTLDLTTGNITHCRNTNNTSTRLQPGDLIQPESVNNKKYEILVIPTLYPTASKGDIEIHFTISGKSYKFMVPEQTHWEKGHKYTYEFVFDGNDILFEKQTSSNWDLEYNQPPAGYWSLSHAFVNDQNFTKVPG